MLLEGEGEWGRWFSEQKSISFMTKAPAVLQQPTMEKSNTIFAAWGPRYEMTSSSVSLVLKTYSVINPIPYTIVCPRLLETCNSKTCDIGGFPVFPPWEFGSASILSTQCILPDPHSSLPHLRALWVQTVHAEVYKYRYSRNFVWQCMHFSGAQWWCISSEFLVHTPSRKR